MEAVIAELAPSCGRRRRPRPQGMCRGSLGMLRNSTGSPTTRWMPAMRYRRTIPGFADPAYRARRAMVDALARSHRHGGEFPVVDYSPAENATWREVYERLDPLRHHYACREYRWALGRSSNAIAGSAGTTSRRAGMSATFLESRTGFRLRPVAGLLSPRDFLNGLAFRVFFSTQYIRHESKPSLHPGTGCLPRVARSRPDVCRSRVRGSVAGNWAGEPRRQ